MTYIQKILSAFSMIVMMSTFAHSTDNLRDDDSSAGTSSTAAASTILTIPTISDGNTYTKQHMLAAIKGTRTIMKTYNTFDLINAIFAIQWVSGNPMPKSTEALKVLFWQYGSGKIIKNLKDIKEGHLLTREEEDKIVPLRNAFIMDEKIKIGLAVLFSLANDHISQDNFLVFVFSLTMLHRMYQLYLLAEFESILAKGLGFPEGHKIFGPT